ncbi:glycosyltransferase family 2 protein [Croceicoccus sp. Ery5]|uniref:glycosyltransferase family 2 protein n=1 Tax=Croceicoccus sp. Ery5 TaxID=1703340 RepID=UPI001E475D2F|nr:glycosyltransferase family 2 protein [Croceicoccus sp. Ery5]
MNTVKSRVVLAMPVYNGANFVEQAILSILDQDYADFRLIVTDNASTDDTGDIVRALAKQDDRITYVRNRENLGASRNYNLGYDLSDSKYLKWCAHDDLLSANYLGECVVALDADEGLALAFGRTISIDTDGNRLPPVPWDTPDIDNPDAAARFEQIIDLFGRMCFPIFGLMRRSALAKTDLHPSYYGSDQALLAELALRGRWKRIEDAVLWNRDHNQRSLAIEDKLERAMWQGGSKNRMLAAEHIQLLRHLWQIGGQHGDVAAPWALRKIVLKRAVQPKQMGRYVLEATSLVSPAMARRMRGLVTRSPAQAAAQAKAQAAPPVVAPVQDTAAVPAKGSVGAA